MSGIDAIFAYIYTWIRTIILELYITYWYLFYETDPTTSTKSISTTGRTPSETIEGMSISTSTISSSSFQTGTSSVVYQIHQVPTVRRTDGTFSSTTQSIISTSYLPNTERSTFNTKEINTTKMESTTPTATPPSTRLSTGRSTHSTIQKLTMTTENTTSTISLPTNPMHYNVSKNSIVRKGPKSTQKGKHMIGILMVFNDSVTV